MHNCCSGVVCCFMSGVCVQVHGAGCAVSPIANRVGVWLTRICSGRESCPRGADQAWAHCQLHCCSPGHSPWLPWQPCSNSHSRATISQYVCVLSWKCVGNCIVLWLTQPTSLLLGHSHHSKYEKPYYASSLPNNTQTLAMSLRKFLFDVRAPWLSVLVSCFMLHQWPAPI